MPASLFHGRLMYLKVQYALTTHGTYQVLIDFTPMTGLGEPMGIATASAPTVVGAIFHV